MAYGPMPQQARFTGDDGMVRWSQWSVFIRPRIELLTCGLDLIDCCLPPETYWLARSRHSYFNQRLWCADPCSDVAIDCHVTDATTGLSVPVLS